MRAEVVREVEQFLYREARLLDERRFREWLELLTDDVRYWMPGRSTRYPKGSKALVILDPDRYSEEELTRDDELAVLDETKETLGRRIARLETGMAWAGASPVWIIALEGSGACVPGALVVSLCHVRWHGGFAPLCISSMLVGGGRAHACHGVPDPRSRSPSAAPPSSGQRRGVCAMREAWSWSSRSERRNLISVEPNTRT
jgi:Ring hydroxylating beta subunit